MEDFFEHYGISNEARVSIILNTFMYIDDCIDIDDFYRKKFRYPTLKEVVEQISIEPEHVKGSSDWDEAEWGSKPKEDSNNGALNILQEYLARDEYQDIANLEVVNFSDQMGEEYKGAYAATFRDPNSSNIFVVYRGTGLGRWFDNGIGLSQEASPIQGVAQRFFDDTISQLGLTENANLIVTGHSKGGNLAQYTTLTAENRALIDKCISFDGQGFSPEFVEMKQNDVDYENQIQKMYSICGDKDYVNVLGTKVIPQSHTMYIVTDTGIIDMPNAHTIVPLGPGTPSDLFPDSNKYLFNYKTNSFNIQTPYQNMLSRFSMELSQSIMRQPASQRADLCQLVMFFLESDRDGNKIGLNGEHLTSKNITGSMFDILGSLPHISIDACEIIIEDFLFTVFIAPNYQEEDLESMFGTYETIDPFTNQRRIMINFSNATVDQKAAWAGSHPNSLPAFFSFTSMLLEATGDLLHILYTPRVLIYDGIHLISDLFVDACEYLVDLYHRISAVYDLGRTILEAMYQSYLDQKAQEHYDEVFGIDHFMGTENDDELSVAQHEIDKRTYIHGLGGNDTIRGGDKDDYLFGDEGEDKIFGAGGNDHLYGGADNDLIHGNNGDDFLYGQDGNDVLKGGNGDDYIDGGTGNDELYGNDGEDVLYGGSGDDLLVGGSHSDTIYGDYEEYDPDADPGATYNDTIYGDHQNDPVSGSKDTIYGGKGDDYIYGGGGSDELHGGFGNDHIYGENGFDTIYGDFGDNWLHGGKGNDTIYGGVNNDYIFGDDDNDTLSGGAGNDLVKGGDGNDVLEGGYGIDTLIGEGGDDTYIFDKDIRLSEHNLGHVTDQDTVRDTRGRNTILFRNTPTKLEEFEKIISFRKAENGLDLIISSTETDASMTLERFFSGLNKSEYYIKIEGGSYYTVEEDAETGELKLKRSSWGGSSGGSGSGSRNSFTGDIIGGSIDSFSDEFTAAGRAQPPSEPLILHLNGGEDIEFIPMDDTHDPIYFDLDKNGFAERIAWIGPDDGYLALDRNGNGKIDDGGELFTNYVVMGTDENDKDILSENGFEALKALDSNHDDLIDENDDVFRQLRVWKDTNQDGKSDGELHTLEELGIKSISLNCRDTEDPTPADGVLITEISDVTFVDDTTTTIRETWFDVQKFNTVEVNMLGDGTYALSSFGNLKSIDTAVAEDETGELAAMVAQFNQSADYLEKRVLTKKILYFISGADQIARNSRGGTMDARDLHVIETIMGVETFIGAGGGTNPNSSAAVILNRLYQEFENLYFTILNRNSIASDALSLITETYDEAGNLVPDMELLNLALEGRAVRNETADDDILSICSCQRAFDYANNTHYLNEFKEAHPDKAAMIDRYLNLTYVIGSPDNDTLGGTTAHEVFWAEDGNDTVNASAGDDILLGGNGADTLNGGAGNDELYGADGNDILNGDAGNDVLYGADGNDILNGDAGNDVLYGEAGDDVLSGGAGDDDYIIGANHGNDTIRDTEGDNRIVFTDGLSIEDYDTAVSAKGGFILKHQETGETISLPDFLRNPLNYDIVAENGASEMIGGSRDVIEGTADADEIEIPDGGFHVVNAGEGDDIVEGGTGIDFVYGGDGDDIIDGKNGTNVLFGDAGNDQLYDGKDGSWLDGGDGDDELYGGNGENVLIGGNGNDIIYDGDDASWLEGDDGDDRLYGGGGADTLDGGAGNDYLQGDHGNDTYVFGVGYDTDTVNASSDNNTILIHGYKKSDMVNTRNLKNDLIIHFGSADSSDCLIVDHFFDYNSNRDIKFVFDDGTVLEQGQITAKYEPIYGTEGNDWIGVYNSDDAELHGLGGDDGISGGSGNDTLDGGEGNDQLYGGNGSDTYIFAKGYGNDSICDWNGSSTIVLTDINSDEVVFTEQNGSDLVLGIEDLEDTLTVSGYRWNMNSFTFKFADGAEGYVDRSTWSLVLTKQPDPVEEPEQAGAEALESLYEFEAPAAELFADAAVLPELSAATALSGSEVADMTDLQTMLLAENMSAFGSGSAVSDGVQFADIAADTFVPDVLLADSGIAAR